MRNNYSPSTPLRGRVQSISKGGTNADKAATAAVSLNLVLATQKNQVGGPAGLDSTGKLAGSTFPSANGTNKVNVSGNLSPNISSVGTYQITDYDSFRVYTVAVSAGSFTISGDTITFTAPATPQSVNMTINGRIIPLNVIQPAPQQPSITSPVNGSTNININNAAFTASAFVAVGDSSTHTSSDWQIATDSAFTNVVQQSLNDTANKTSWTTTLPSLNTVYYARVRYKGSNGNSSVYSATVSFTSQVTASALSTEEAILFTSDKANGDQFGWSVSITADGTRVIVGAYGKTSTEGNNYAAYGYAYIFTRTGNSWTQEAKLGAQDWQAANMLFGWAVSISKDGLWVAVGAPGTNFATVANSGRVYTFSRSGTTWTPQSALQSDSAAANENWGYSVALSSDGTTLVASAYNSAAVPGGTATGVGTVYIFTRVGAAWTRRALISSPETSGSVFFGVAVAIDNAGTRVAIGSSGAALGKGAVYIFSGSGASWGQEAKITPADAATDDGVGKMISLATDASRLVIGLPTSDPSGVTNAGAVYIYTRTNTTWAQETKLTDTTLVANRQFGTSVACNSDCSKLFAASYSVGKGNLYNRSGTSWALDTVISPSGGLTGIQFGIKAAMATDTSRLAVTAASAASGGVTSGGCYIER